LISIKHCVAAAAEAAAEEYFPAASNGAPAAVSVMAPATPCFDLRSGAVIPFFLKQTGV
jgi:hypothetical protein